MPTIMRQRLMLQFLSYLAVVSTTLFLVPLAASHSDPGTTIPSLNLEVPNPDGPVRAGFDADQLPPMDDGSSSLLDLGFNVHFFGQTYDGLYVNNNGNLTFDSPLAIYTPFGLLNTSRVIIAPFFADVDTRAANLVPGNVDTNVVTYGSGTVDGQTAFGANWQFVGCFDRVTSVLNNFQVILIDRADIGQGDFDIEFNYDQIQWEAGMASGGSANCQGGSTARVGYSNGITTSFEITGSGIPGAFLDSNTATGLIHNQFNSPEQLGRYKFKVRNGVIPMGGTISGHVYGISSSTPVADALVQVCGESLPCARTSTDSSGRYQVSGLDGGDYVATAYPPATMPDFSVATIGPLILPTNGTLTYRDITLVRPIIPPPGTTLQPGQIGANGMLVVDWQHELTLTHENCASGAVTFEVFQGNASQYSGTMVSSGPGVYTANIPPLHPFHGYARFRITIVCPGSPQSIVEFDVYVDPSSHVRTIRSEPLPDATVTLYHSETLTGTFSVVPEGSAVMAPENRRNPDTTNAEGGFGWNAFAGYYKVRAHANVCHAPGDPHTSYVETGILNTPPRVTDLDIHLECPAIFLPIVIQSDCPFAEMVVTLVNSRPVGCTHQVTGRAVPRCGSARRTTA